MAFQRRTVHSDKKKRKIIRELSFVAKETSSIDSAHGFGLPERQIDIDQDLQQLFEQVCAFTSFMV